jgi:branched-chain amino acid transport system permease protein
MLKYEPVLLQFVIDGLCAGAVTGMVALGFALIYHSTRVLHFAHGATFAVAGYAAYSVVGVGGGPAWLAMAAGLAAATVLGAVSEYLIFQPLLARAASPAVLMISSLGMYVAVVNAIPLWYGSDAKYLRDGPDVVYGVGMVSVGRVQLAQLIAAGAVGIAYWLLLRQTTLGQRWRALADNAELLTVLGCTIRPLQLAAFCIASAMAGAAGVLSALDVGLDPQVGMSATLNGAVATIVAGPRRFLLPLGTGIGLGLLQRLVGYVASDSWQSAAAFTLLVGFLLFRPDGLLATTRRAEDR